MLTLIVAVVSGAWLAALLGGGVSLAGALLGLLLCHRAITMGQGSAMRRTNKLMGAFVVGMLARLVILAASLALVMVLFGWEPIVFIVAFFTVHAISQVLEIGYVHKKKNSAAIIAV